MKGVEKKIKSKFIQTITVDPKEYFEIPMFEIPTVVNTSFPQLLHVCSLLSEERR